MNAQRDESEALALGALISAQASESGSTQEAAWAKAGEERLLGSLRHSGLTSTAAERAQSNNLKDGAQPAIREAKQRRARSWVLAALALAGLCAALFWFPLQAPNTALQFQAADGKWRSDGHVEAAEMAQAIQFSDGSRLTLDAGSKVRVRSTDAHGAEVVVEDGSLMSTVVHADKTAWSVFAGPYEVRVIGTRFTTSWSSKTQRVSVVLHEGTVQILGAGIDGKVELRPGQRFDASGQTDHSWKVTPLDAPLALPPAPPTPGSEESKSANKPPQEPKSTARKPASAPPPKQPSWSTLVAEGKFAAVIGLAEAQGLPQCLAHCSTPHLRALADAARYTGDVNTAREVLTRLREVPAERARAGYLLGSLSEARGQAANALKHYTSYINEAPTGSLASEAHVGRMRCLLALGRLVAAQAAARGYLQAYPKGTGAKTAHDILQK